MPSPHVTETIRSLGCPARTPEVVGVVDTLESMLNALYQPLQDMTRKALMDPLKKKPLTRILFELLRTQNVRDFVNAHPNMLEYILINPHIVDLSRQIHPSQMSSLMYSMLKRVQSKELTRPLFLAFDCRNFLHGSKPHIYKQTFLSFLSTLKQFSDCILIGCKVRNWDMSVFDIVFDVKDGEELDDIMLSALGPVANVFVVSNDKRKPKQRKGCEALTGVCPERGFKGVSKSISDICKFFNIECPDVLRDDSLSPPPPSVHSSPSPSVHSSPPPISLHSSPPAPEPVSSPVLYRGSHALRLDVSSEMLQSSSIVSPSATTPPTVAAFLALVVEKPCPSTPLDTRKM